FSASNANEVINAVFWIFLLIFCFSLLKYTYYYNYRSHISLQVAKLAKSAGVQILIFPTVCFILINLRCVLIMHGKNTPQKCIFFLYSYQNETLHNERSEEHTS